MGLCKTFYRLVRNFLIVFFVVVLLPGLPPKTHFDFQSFIIPKASDLTGPLEVNYLLDNAERLFEGQVHGPECLLKRDGEMYASIVGGEIIKISGDHITHVAKLGKPCEGAAEEKICGRPLGMAFDTVGNNLIVADAYYGIWLVDLKTGKKTNLVSPKDEQDGKIKRRPAIFNSVAVSKSGDIYWTDSSSDFQLEDGIYTFLANPSGRLFHYNRATKQNKVLIDELYFANGVALSPNEDFVVVAETASSRLMRYYLKGEKAGQSDVFIHRMPGMPDNLTPDADGLWVPLVMSVDKENPAVHQSAANLAWIRKFFLRILYLIEVPFKMIEQMYPNLYTQTIVHRLGNFALLKPVNPARNTILRVDWNGKIVGSLHGFDGSVTHIAHVLEDGEYLYLGSFVNNYLGRVKLPKVYKNSKVAAKSSTTTTTPKPTTTTSTTTTTTPRPTTTTSTTTTTTPRPTSTTSTTTTTTPRPTSTTSTTTTTTTTTTTPKPPVVPKKVEAPKKVETPIKVETPQKVETPNVKEAPKVKEVPEPTQAPKVAQQAKPKEPAPIEENIASDSKRPVQQKMKIIKKGGAQGEL